MHSVKFDKNNIETGLWLEESLRYYVDNSCTRYVHKYGMIGQALKASCTILNI